MSKLRRNALVTWVTVICQLSLLLPAGSGPVWAQCCPCEEEYTTDTPITTPTITDPAVDDTVTCTNSQQIIAERPMYFNYSGQWPGGHDVVGK